jgi:hypothetical protein
VAAGGERALAFTSPNFSISPVLRRAARNIQTNGNAAAVASRR